MQIVGYRKNKIPNKFYICYVQDHYFDLFIIHVLLFPDQCVLELNYLKKFWSEIILSAEEQWENFKIKFINEPRHENQNFTYAKTKTQISCAVTAQLAQLISAFVFATWVVQSLLFLYPKFQAFSLLL